MLSRLSSAYVGDWGIPCYYLERDGLLGNRQRRANLPKDARTLMPGPVMVALASLSDLGMCLRRGH